MVILITESKDYSEKALATYRSLGEVIFFDALPSAKKSNALAKADVLVVRLNHKIAGDWMEKMPNLKAIATPTTGLNHIDLEEAKRRGVRVVSLRGRTGFLKYIPSTAEETLALMLSLVRNIPWAFEDVKKGNWNRDRWRGRQLVGKTLGILGCGRLGKIVAKYAKALGMEVVGSDPNVEAKVMKRYGIRKVSAEKLFKESDIVSLHVLLTDDTYNLIKEKHLRSMKPSSFLINTARAELIEKGALLKALKNKWLAGAAVDVMWDETGKSAKHLRDNPLLEYAKSNQNLLIVPHIGGATHEAMQVTENFIADLVKNYFKKHGSR